MMTKRGLSHSQPKPQPAHGNRAFPVSSVTGGGGGSSEGGRSDDDVALEEGVESIPLLEMSSSSQTVRVLVDAAPATAAAAAPALVAIARRRPGDRLDVDSGGSGDGGDSDWTNLTVLAAAAIFICYADRANISTAIIPMAAQFGWDKVAEGGVLSAFFYGYALTQLLGGRLADKFGGKPVLTAGVLGWSLATFMTPIAAAAGAAPLVLARVALGAGEGVAFPAVHTMISRHVPRHRQSTAVAAVTAASYGGAAFAFGVTPAVVLHGGWEAAFFTFGTAAVLWVPFWLPAEFKVVNDPTAIRSGGGGSGGGGGNDRLSSDSTLGDGLPLGNTLGGGLPLDSSADSGASLAERSRAGVSLDGSRQLSATQPTGGGVVREWLALVKTPEVRAICAAQFAQSWGGYGLLSWLPTYFDEALGVPLGDLPAFTVLPYFIQGVVGLGSGIWADRLVREGKYSVKFIRRAFQTVGMVGPAACLLVAAYLGSTSGGGASGGVGGGPHAPAVFGRGAGLPQRGLPRRGDRPVAAADF